MTRSPKQAFLESPHKISHEKFVQTESFQTACDYALLVLVQEQPHAPDPSKGWDSHSQLIGARRVLDILKSLSEAEKQPEPVKQKTLNYKV